VKSRNKLRDHEKKCKNLPEIFCKRCGKGRGSRFSTVYILHFTMNRMNKNKHLTTEEIAIIIQLYRTNLHSQAEIARMLGISVSFFLLF
jgi:DNA invertase Pin-like site-specific DNA recombinase